MDMQYTPRTLEAARQQDIEVGDKVRSFDFPTRSDCFIEGVVIAIDREHRDSAAAGGTVTVHATACAVEGSYIPTADGYRVFKAPLGVSSLTRQPAVMLIEKRPAAACPRCGGWTTSGGMSQHAQAKETVLGRYGCSCKGGNLTLRWAM